MKKRHVGPIVAGSLAAGFITAAVLVAGPFAGAQEHVITGIALLAIATGWALLAGLSICWTDKPQQWAAAPAGFLGIVGAGLLLFEPDGAAIDALGWVWPPILIALIVWMIARTRQHLPGRTRRWLVYPVFFMYALCALGGSYQTVRESTDHRMDSSSGSLVDVEGHRLYLSCSGSGAPTVILESGLGESSAYWGWIAPVVAQDTKVCVYDRAGRGASEPAAFPQDGVGVARDLNTLLARARVAGPFVLVGHSSGAQYVRIFAGRYPEQVAGMVLLDGQPTEAFTRLPIFPSFYRNFRRIFAVLPSLSRLGLGRLIYHNADFDGLPIYSRDVQRVNYSSPRQARSLRDEFAELPTAMAQANSVQSLGDRPLIVVTAARDAMTGWLPLQDELTALSTNSLHRVLPNATHVSLIENKKDALISSQAIRDVVASVRDGRPLSER